MASRIQAGSNFSTDIRSSAAQPLVVKGPTFPYVEVDNREETITAVMGAEVAMPKRKTFYGSTETGIKHPAGHLPDLGGIRSPLRNDRARIARAKKKGAIRFAPKS